MAENAIYTVKYRRKREGKTHYKKRLEYLKSGKERLVIRRSNTQITLQIIKYQEDGDKVIASFPSKNLEKLGWKFSKKSLPAAYLAGLQLGKLAGAKGVKSAILDLGLQTPMSGSKLYAALKGVVDAGITIPASEEIFPSDERLSGSHIPDADKKKIVETFNQVKSKINGEK